MSIHAVPLSWEIAARCAFGSLLVLLFLSIPPTSNAQEALSRAEFRKNVRVAADHAIMDLVTEVSRGQTNLTPKMGFSNHFSLRYFGRRSQSGNSTRTQAMSGDGEAVALQFLQQYAAAFGIYSNENYLTVKRKTARNGRTYLRFGQDYDGIPVFGAEIVVVVENGEVKSVNADIMRDTFPIVSEAVSLQPQLDATTVRQIAESEASMRLSTLRSSILASNGSESTPRERREQYEEELNQTAIATQQPPALVLYDPEVVGAPGSVKLAWAVSVASTPVPLVNDEILVDAHSGEIAFEHSRLHNARYREVWDSQDQETASGATLERDENDPAHQDDDVNHNFDCLGLSYDYFNTNLSWDSFDGAGESLLSYIHWGVTDHAAWESGSEIFHFGTGGYAEADDIVGHEYAHAVIDHTAGLLGAGEAGAIAESIADAFGEFIDWSGGWSTDLTQDRWLIGEDLSGGAIRDMSDPEAFDQPSWMGSVTYYHDDAYPAIAASVNSGVGNNLWHLLVDGGTFRGYVIDPLGDTQQDSEEMVRDLLWELLDLLPQSASYLDLYTQLGDAAENLQITKLQDLEAACEAIAIHYDTDDTYSGTKSLPTVTVRRNAIEVDPEDGYGHFWAKSIPYKVHIPDNVEDPNARCYWPLDVIILCHGAGMNREVASGYPGSVDGLATYWAEQGYIVVCPTFRKRRVGLSGPWWEWPINSTKYPDNAVRFVTDLLHGYTKGAQFFGNRIRDILFIQDELEAILNVGTTNGCYHAQSSRIALAGHSMGAVTTTLAAGAETRGIRLAGALGQIIPVIDLEDQGLRRMNDNGTPGDTSDDYGPFVEAVAYMPMSADFQGEHSELTLIDSTRPNMTGQDFIQGPLAVLTADLDFAAESPLNFTPVTDAIGLNAAPKYGVAIDGANHITPVSNFTTRVIDWPSWSPLWNIFVFFQNHQVLGDLTSEEGIDISEYEDDLEVVATAIFRSDESQQDEIARLAVYKKYTLAFWDAYLTPEYDTSPNDEFGLSFLDDDKEVHEEGPYVEEFAFAPITRGFIVRGDDGRPLVQFQADGNTLMLEGELTESASAGQLAPTPTRGFILRDSSNAVVARIDPDTGDFYIKGTKSENQSALSSSAASELIVRRASDDTTQIILDENGNLKLRGEVYKAPLEGP